jgi:benzaldehyde dehydrogenase (NAD)
MANDAGAVRADSAQLMDGKKWHGRAFVGGGWETLSATRDVTEPATGASLGKIALAEAADIAKASAAARAAQPSWANTAYDDRAKMLRTVAGLLEEHRAEVVNWIVRESGSIIPKAEFEVGLTIKLLYNASSLPSMSHGDVLPSHEGRISIARRRPIGVVGVISPFNFPLYLAMRAVAPAVALGNAVVLKPDPRTAVCGGTVIARLFEQAGLPANVLQMLPGDAEAGAALCSDANVGMIQFTGSTAAGRKVGELAGKHLKKVSLELGGKNSLIILDDADLDLAIANATWGAFLHQGQICMASGRVLVHSAIVDAFAAKMAEKARMMPVGDPTTGAVALGPMINSSQRDRAQRLVDQSVAQGAKLIAGGKSEGLFYSPTVVNGVKPGMALYSDEAFAPIIAITSFNTDDEAVALANDTDYGLSAGILTNSIARAMAIGEKLQVGLLHINDQTVNDEVINPFGGVGISGNGTGIGGPANWEEFTHWQWMTIKGAPPADPL